MLAVMDCKNCDFVFAVLKGYCQWIRRLRVVIYLFVYLFVDVVSVMFFLLIFFVASSALFRADIEDDVDGAIVVAEVERRTEFRQERTLRLLLFVCIRWWSKHR